MGNKISRLAITAVLTIAPFAAHCESLIEIYDLALENDPIYLGAIANNKSAHETTSVSGSNFLPTLSVSGSGSTNDPDTETTRYAATLQQKLFNWSDIVTHRQNKSYIKQSDADLTASKQDLIIRVAEQFFKVLAAQDNITFTRAEKQAISRQLDQAKQRFEVGVVAITDVHEAQARYDRSIAQGIDADNGLDAALEILREMTGQYHDSFAILDKKTMLMPPEPNDIDQWTKMALTNNFKLISAQYATNQAKEAINIAKARTKPTLSFSASRSYFKSVYKTQKTSFFATGNGAYFTNFSLNLDMEIFSGGGINASIRQAQHNYQSARASLMQITRGTQRKVRNAYLKVIAGISLAKALRQAVISSESALRASEAGFEVGTRTTVDVLLARQQLYSAQTGHAQARYNYIDQLLRLKRAAGSLDKKDLEQINGWLTPPV